MEHTASLLKSHEHDDHNKNDIISYGGVTRTVVRNFLRKVGKTQNHLIPRPRTVAKSADKLSELLELREQMKSARENLPKEKSSMFSKSIGIIKQMAPGFLKSSIAGTLVFSSYEYTYSEYNVSIFEQPSNTRVVMEKDGSLSKTTAIAASCGALGGLASGSFILLWEKLSSRIDFNGHLPKLIPSSSVRTLPVAGTILFHVLVSASMFASYEWTKNVFFKSAEFIVGAPDAEDEREEHEFINSGNVNNNNSSSSSGSGSGGNVGVDSHRGDSGVKWDGDVYNGGSINNSNSNSNSNTTNNNSDTLADYSKYIERIIFSSGDTEILSPAPNSTANDDESGDFYVNYYLNKHRYLLYDLFSIAIAGAFSGIVSETLSYYLAPLESAVLLLRTGHIRHHGIELRRLFRLAKGLPTPGLRTLLTASIPCSLGFLAYEYGKSEYELESM